MPRHTHRRWVIAFVADIRNIPKKTDLRHRALQEKGVRLRVLDIDYNAEEAEQHKVTKAPYFIVMEKDVRGFNSGMFAEPYQIRRTSKLSDIEKWTNWLSQRTS